VLQSIKAIVGCTGRALKKKDFPYLGGSASVMLAGTQSEHSYNNRIPSSCVPYPLKSLLLHSPLCDNTKPRQPRRINICLMKWLYICIYFVAWQLVAGMLMNVLLKCFYILFSWNAWRLLFSFFPGRMDNCDWSIRVRNHPWVRGNESQFIPPLSAWQW
jgi:hypothetical protein